MAKECVKIASNFLKEDHHPYFSTQTTQAGRIGDHQDPLRSQWRDASEHR